MRKGLLLKGAMVGLGLVMVFSLLFLSGASAAEFPSKAIQIICGYAPGGPQDLVPRILSKRLSDLLGQTVVVVNKPAGGGVIAAESVLSAEADGHTIMVSEQAIINNPLTKKNLGYTLKDFTPLSIAMKVPMNVFVRNDARWQTFEQFITEAKKNPGKISYSSGGPGLITHLAAEVLQMHTGTKFTHVPFSGGGGPALAAALGGHVDWTVVSPSNCKPYYDAGKIRILVTMSDKRYKHFPDVPTAPEVGYPKMLCGSWSGFFVSAKTPSPIIKKLADTFHEVLKENEIIAQIDKAGMVPENLEQKEAIRFLAEEEKKWSEILKAAGLTPQ